MRARLDAEETSGCGRLVAQTASATLYHLASFRPSLREPIADFPLETMNPGDVFVFNDQFRGGIHANDILVFTPVFNAGEVVFFTCDLMHVADLGGVSAGGRRPRSPRPMSARWSGIT